MRAMNTIKDACAEALENDTPDGRSKFQSVVDPASVMEMAGIIESLLTYVDKVDDLTAQELALEVKHKIAGKVEADGAV